ncbi:unnamed protein product [Durusdinium trenchii]|uniref:Cyclin-dependent kinase 2 homolog n=2 Tax=Durusdinium trenchii TaxID=1381693 RepID=A0ABP0ISQ6_9DINO
MAPHGHPRKKVETPLADEHLGGRYAPLEKIGGGNYGEVMRMKDVVTGKVVAVKSSSQVIEEGLSSWSLREISALRACQHPNVVQLLDVHAVPESVHLILEFMPFDLSQYMRRVLKGPFADLKPAFRQILLGLGHCHRQGYLHRDLKPQNILVDGGTLKLADFGLASRRYLWPFRCQKPLTKFVVTVWYRAPELILMDSGQCMYGQGVDIWSLGCILAEMATNRPMFPGDSEIDTLFKIFRMKGTPAATTWPGLEQMGHFSRSFPHWEDTNFQKVLEACPFHHTFLQQMLGAMLQYVPNQRWSAYALLSHPFFEGQSESCNTSASLMKSDHPSGW